MKKTRTVGQKDRLVTEAYLDQKLEGFATKDDLKNFATKDDLKNFATKDDLEKGLNEINEDISKLFYEKIDKIQESQDKLLKKFETWEQENEIGANQIRELRVDVDDHGEISKTRINKLTPFH
ncbi:MAG: hypothetical protein Q7T54_05885 [Candidatus Levybacteria bacterium]|nr:hypothetical protein [Candidatus Levybacteria bacterium]